MKPKKNKGAVHLGKLSAKSRRKKLGVKAYRQKMKEMRHIQMKQKASQKLSPAGT